MSLDKFTLFGQSSPTFDEQLCVNKPAVADRSEFIDRVHDVLDSQMFTNGGPQVKSLEEKVAKYLGVKHCVTTCNGTMALQLIMKALDLSGEVIVPSFTFIASAHAILWQNLKPVFCDVDPKTHLIDVDACKSLINDQTSAILGVHLWGQACDDERLQLLADDHGLKIIYDAAHAFGSHKGGTMIGNFGHAEAFSFHATKIFHTFEGGAVTTNCDELAQKIRRLRNFGFYDYDRVDGLGINAKMPEICAAMGLVNLKTFDQFLSHNREIYYTYKSQIDQLDGLQLLPLGGDHAGNNFQYIVVEIDEQSIGLSRDEVVKILHAENVMARRYFHPGCHLMQPYAEMPESRPQYLNNTNDLTSKIMVLPGGYCMSSTLVNKIGELLSAIIDEASSISKALKSN